MYATPVIYPVSSIPERFQWIIQANPMTPIVEAFRYAFLGAGTVNPLPAALQLRLHAGGRGHRACHLQPRRSRRLWIRCNL